MNLPTPTVTIDVTTNTDSFTKKLRIIAKHFDALADELDLTNQEPEPSDGPRSWQRDPSIDAALDILHEAIGTTPDHTIRP